jgi:hypothetical protein
MRQYGQAYLQYKRRVGAFWPWKPFNLDFGLSDDECVRLLQTDKKEMKSE